MSVRIVAILLSVVLALSGSSNAVAQSSAALEFHARIIDLYSFQPHTLVKDQLLAKSGKLDEFWSYAKKNPDLVLPLLREELANGSNPSFFFYDGAKLLLSLSSDNEDRKLALRSLPKADLRDIQTTDYLTTIHWFASNGFDTREAAFRILAYPDFKAFIPQHSLMLGQNYSLICMLFPLQNIPFERDLISRLETEHNPDSQKSLLLALWYTMTPAGMAAIKEFGKKPGLDESVAEYARGLAARRAGFTLSLSSAESLRSERAKLMQRPISDEALSEFDALTLKILAKQ
jgi:hypothetical protein